jgi:hypothetical protein
MPTRRAMDTAVSGWSPVNDDDANSGGTAVRDRLRDLRTWRAEHRDQTDEAQITLGVHAPVWRPSVDRQGLAHQHPQAAAVQNDKSTVDLHIRSRHRHGNLGINRQDDIRRRHIQARHNSR